MPLGLDRLAQHGLSLLEMTVALAILGIFCCFAVWQWREPVIRVQHAAARTQLLHAAVLMEHWYDARESSGGGNMAWPSLAYLDSAHYQLSFGSALDRNKGKYRIYARPLPGAADTSTFFLLDEAAVVRVCTQKGGHRDCL